MEFFGIMAFFISLSGLSSKSKIKKLEKEIKKLKGGSFQMSKMIESLVGKFCKITQGDFCTVIEATIIDVDEDWVKIEKTNKKGVKNIQIIRIEDISKIEVND